MKEQDSYHDCSGVRTVFLNQALGVRRDDPHFCSNLAPMTPAPDILDALEEIHHRNAKLDVV